MPNFIVNTNAQANGDHEVHDRDSTRGCLPAIQNQYALGYHDSCRGAVQMAKRIYSVVNGCAYCAPACHTR